MNSRLKKILIKLGQQKLDALFVSSPANISYLTKTQSRDSYLLISNKGIFYITDSRYTEEARLALEKSIKIKKVNGPLPGLIAELSLDYGLKRIGFEEKHLSFSGHMKIRKGLNKKIKLVPVPGIIEDSRQIKETQEIKIIKKAIRITAAAFKFIEGFIRPGQKEIELVAELQRFIRYHAAGNSAFDIIAASGPNSSFPHHIPGQRKIRRREPVLIDMGIDFLGYKTDLTRVFFLDKISAYGRKIYDIILEAQARALNKIKPGALTDEIDAAARQYITEKGYGGFFGHNLGHGVGLEVHEKPMISPKKSTRLKQGMIFTLEPAIYLPGEFGIRLEDMVLVTKKGYEVLSGAINK